MKYASLCAAAVLGLVSLLFLSPGPGAAQDYILGEGDLLKITVYENEDLVTEARVSGDGVVSIPLVGPVKVAGRSVMEAENAITALLSDGYIVDPHVTVFVKEYRSKKVTILGEVNKPGLYELEGSASLLEIISKAGGLAANAGDTVLIKRKGAREEKAQVDDLSAGIMVLDGDSIYVTKSGSVYVTGEVKKPGAYKYEQGMTVIKAVALAEGLTDKASPGRTRLIRKVEGREVSFKVDMGFQVQPDDVVSVPESFF